MKPIHWLGLNRAIALAAVAVSQMALLSPIHAQAVTFLDLSGGLTGWTTAGTVSGMPTTDAYAINGTPYSLTPAEGDSMAKISPEGAAAGSVDSLLRLAWRAVRGWTFFTIILGMTASICGSCRLPTRLPSRAAASIRMRVRSAVPWTGSWRRTKQVPRRLRRMNCPTRSAV